MPTCSAAWKSTANDGGQPGLDPGPGRRRTFDPRTDAPSGYDDARRVVEEASQKAVGIVYSLEEALSMEPSAGRGFTATSSRRLRPGRLARVRPSCSSTAPSSFTARLTGMNG